MDWANPKPQAVTNLDIAFGGKMADLLPPMAQIPKEFTRDDHWAARLFSRLFFDGGKVAHLKAKPGIDRVLALRHIKAIMGSFEPKHEHKAAACAYLFSVWFEQPEVP